jgi:hypothetical protein
MGEPDSSGDGVPGDPDSSFSGAGISKSRQTAILHIWQALGAKSTFPHQTVTASEYLFYFTLVS